MVTRTATFEGSSILQKDMYDEGIAPNFLCNDQYGLKFAPTLTDGSKVEAEATNTYQPGETDDFIWNRIIIETIRQTTVTPADFLLKFTLQGINNGGYISDIAKQVITTCPTTETSQFVVFDLLNSACQSSFNTINASAGTGKIRVDLPLPYEEYESCTLNRSWLEDFPKRKMQTVTGTAAACDDYVYKRIGVTYDSDMNADFSDIRFVDYDGITPMPYTLISKTDSASAVFNVRAMRSPATSAVQNYYIHYNNPTATSESNGFNTHSYGYDDFGDGLTTGRTLPYVNWSNTIGTTSIESSSPISGSYSLKHTGPGTSTAQIGFNKPWSYDDYSVEFDVKCTTQGTDGTSPNLTLYMIRYEDYQNWFKLSTYYDSGTNRQILQLIRNVAGSLYSYADVNWQIGKMPANTTYTFRIAVTDSHVAVWDWYSNAMRLLINVAADPEVDSGLIGGGCNHNTVCLWDNFMWSPVPDPVGTPTFSSWGAEESTVTVNPDTPASTDQSILFSTPADWSSNSYSYLKIKQYDKLEYNSRSIPISNLSVATLGVDGLDQYNALRVLVEAECNSDYSFSIPSIKYLYEI